MKKVMFSLSLVCMVAFTGTLLASPAGDKPAPKATKETKHVNAADKSTGKHHKLHVKKHKKGKTTE